MTTRRNHGARAQRRRDVAMYNLATRLRLSSYCVDGSGGKPKPKDIERMEAEIEVLKQRGAK